MGLPSIREARADISNMARVVLRVRAILVADNSAFALVEAS